MKAALTLLIVLSLSGLSLSLFRKHFFVAEKMSWSNAQRHCREHHHDLSTVSAGEARLLSANPQITGVFFWIGLYQNHNLWIWSGGDDQVVDNWDFGEPDYFTEDCAAVYKFSAKLHNLWCTLRQMFYCMEVFQLILVKENKTWDEALNYCREHYSDLASLSSQEIMTDAVSNAVQSQTARVWTGLRFMAGHWFWASGDDLQFIAWSAEGEPQCPARNLRCGALDRANNAWSPTNCEEKLNFVCFVKP